MIITVTFNPAIDKTAEVDRLRPGELHRLKNTRMDAGGKGVNVSKTIHALGGNSICTGFLAGTTGKFIEKTLDDMQIQNAFIWVEGSTRTNLKVIDQNMELTELNEAGPRISQSKLDELVCNILSLCDKEAIVVLSGNVSSGVNSNIYKEMITRIKEKGAIVILDADGDLFKEGIQARPAIIKPNKHEIATYFGVDEKSSNATIIALAKTLLNEETKLVVVSMGKEGSIFIGQDGVYQANALSIEAHSSVGAGDAMVAAIAYAFQQHYDTQKLIRLAVACSAGAVMSKGTNPADKETVQLLMDQVHIKKVEE